jgi:hypothetical protein
MKNLELENLELEELTLCEKKEMNGGVLGLDDLLVGIGIAVVVQVISDWDNFKRGISGGREIAK